MDKGAWEKRRQSREYEKTEFNLNDSIIKSKRVNERTRKKVWKFEM